MRKIKDRILLGSVSTIVTNLPFQYYNAFIHKKEKKTDVPYGLSSSRIFLTKRASTTTGGKVLSGIVNIANFCMAGTALTYMLSLTGKDYALLKGAGLGTLTWVVAAGLLSKIGLGIESKNPATPLLSFVEHNAYFALSAYLITKLGDDSLFPNKGVREQEKVPVVYSGQQQLKNEDA